LKESRDKQSQVQEYLSRVTQDRNATKLQIETRDKKIKDLEQVVNNFATIQEHLVYKKTKARVQLSVEKIEEAFRQIKEEQKQRLYEEALDKLKRHKAFLSPRGAHVTLIVTDYEQNTVEHTIAVEKNDDLRELDAEVNDFIEFPKTQV